MATMTIIVLSVFLTIALLNFIELAVVQNPNEKNELTQKFAIRYAFFCSLVSISLLIELYF